MERQYHPVLEVLAPKLGPLARETVQQKNAHESHLPLKVMVVGIYASAMFYIF